MTLSLYFWVAIACELKLYRATYGRTYFCVKHSSLISMQYQLWLQQRQSRLLKLRHCRFAVFARGKLCCWVWILCLSHLFGYEAITDLLKTCVLCSVMIHYLIFGVLKSKNSHYSPAAIWRCWCVKLPSETVNLHVVCDTVPLYIKRVCFAILIHNVLLHGWWILVWALDLCWARISMYLPIYIYLIVYFAIFCSLSPTFFLPPQATRELCVSRRWTRVLPAPVTTTGHATPRAPAPWGLAAAAQRASPAPHALSWWTSVPWTPVPTGSAAVWAIATGVCASQVSCCVSNRVEWCLTGRQGAGGC